MDQIQRTLIKAGRKDLADEYYKKIAAYIPKEDLGREFNNSFKELEDAMKKVKNPENWVEKYSRSAPGVLDMMERLTKVFGKMK